MNKSMYPVGMYEEINAYIKRSTLSPNSKVLYLHYLTQFGFWLKLNGFHDWKQINEEQPLDWMAESPEWSASTRYNAAYAIKSFYRWACGVNHPVNLNLKVRRHDPGPQRTLDWDTLQQLLASIDTSTPKGVRDLAMVSLMVDTGLRASEVCRLDLKHLNMKKRELDVVIKGGDWGHGVYFAYTASCMENWLAIRGRFAGPGVNNVFVSIGGNKPGRPLTKDGMRGIFRRMGAAAEIGLISPHDMRRTFATLASRAGAPSRVVQVAGRWSSIAMVERYTKALRPEDMEPYSPMDKLMGE